MSRFAALSATAMLVNFGWTSTYGPDPSRTAPDPYGSPKRGDQRAAAPARGGTPEPAGSDAVASAQSAAHPPGAVADAADGVDERTATAHWFVTAALDGGFGKAHQQAARTAVAVATGRGLVDDLTRVAEALVVFLPPDHR